MKQGILTLEDEAYLVNLAMRMRGVLVMCAPRFSAGSEGENIMTQVLDSFVRLRAIAEAIAKSNRDDDNESIDPHNDK